MHFDHALYMATYFGQNMVPLQSGCTAQMYVFYASPRLEFCWEILADWSAAPYKQWDIRPPELYFNWTKALRDLNRFCDQRLTEICITEVLNY